MNEENLLDHLDEEEAFERLDQLHNELDNAMNRVIDIWMKEGVIDEKGKEKMLKEWSKLSETGIFNFL